MIFGQKSVADDYKWSRLSLIIFLGYILYL